MGLKQLLIGKYEKTLRLIKMKNSGHRLFISMRLFMVEQVILFL